MGTLEELLRRKRRDAEEGRYSVGLMPEGGMDVPEEVNTYQEDEPQVECETIYVPIKILERNNEWLANAIRGITAPEFFIEMVRLGLLSADEIDSLINDTVKEFVEIFLVLQCHMCRRYKSGEETCANCFRRYLEVI